jgi:hypothetical protein
MYLFIPIFIILQDTGTSKRFAVDSKIQNECIEQNQRSKVETLNIYNCQLHTGNLNMFKFSKNINKMFNYKPYIFIRSHSCEA